MTKVRQNSPWSMRSKLCLVAGLMLLRLGRVANEGNQTGDVFQNTTDRSRAPKSRSLFPEGWNDPSCQAVTFRKSPPEWLEVTEKNSSERCSFFCSPSKKKVTVYLQNCQAYEYGVFWYWQLVKPNCNVLWHESVWNSQVFFSPEAALCWKFSMGLSSLPIWQSC